MFSILQSPSQKFETRFHKWLDKSLSKNVPASVKGFAFNLFQYPWINKTGPKYGVELIGADRFDENDSDWACNEVFEGSPRSHKIPIEFSGEDWEQCLRKVSRLISNYINSSANGVEALTSVQGIGVGFVGGDLQLLKNNSIPPVECASATY